jgi:16S rRNA (uracil1498-N3)-methyltransferase
MTIHPNADFVSEACSLSVPRIYLPVPLQSGAEVLLDARAAQHVVRALRLKPGAPLILFNGEGGEYAATLQPVSGATAKAAVGDFIARDAESPLTVTLAQAISRGERMDYAIQKAVELGVTHIQPLVTEFCVVKIHQEHVDKRLAHWQGIIISACEQCGRTRVPTISAPAPYPRWLADCASSVKLVLDPYATQGLSAALGVLPPATLVPPCTSQLPQPAGDITLLIGPEGGLSDAELAQARHAGFIPVRLGARMLRTETAPVAALAAVQTLWGDLR